MLWCHSRIGKIAAAAVIFPLLSLKAAEVNEESIVTPQEFEIVFPKIMGWIEQMLSAHRSLARPVASKHFKRLPFYFSRTQIQAAKVAIVDRIPKPPLSSIGLSRFKEFERGDYDGITYLDTFFLNKKLADDEELHFHEMIHVVQWRLLGAKRFLAVYASGLDTFGYRDSPLEKMAYDAQELFGSGEVFDAEKFVAEKLSASGVYEVLGSEEKR
jgi:hypothetical protein